MEMTNVRAGVAVTAVLFGVAASATEPEKTKTAAGVCPGIVTKLVTVDSRNDEWTGTGVKLKAHDLLIVIAAWKVSVRARSREVDADGAPNGNGRLMIKVGTGTVIPVGQRWVGVAGEEEGGTLKLRVHDTKYTDNEGAFQVIVMQIPDDVIPEPVKVEAE